VTQQLRQLGDISRDPPRLVFGEQFRRRSPARLILERIMLASTAGFGLVVDLRPASRRLYGRQGYNGRHAAHGAEPGSGAPGNSAAPID
jgi:hypothetical protein